MKQSTKIWLITGGALILVGLIVFAGAMTALGWDFSKLSGVTMEPRTYEVGDSFDNLSIDVDIDDVLFQPSDDGRCKVVCDEEEGEERTHTVSVKDKTLTIGAADTGIVSKGFRFFFFQSPKVTVYLPKKTYGALSVRTDSGDVTIPDAFTFGSIDITAATGDVECGASSKGAISIRLSTGDVSLSDFACKSLTVDGSTGDTMLKNVIATGAVAIGRSTGDVTLDSCDAEAFTVKTTTGDVTGSLLSDKVFLTDTTTGDVSVPQTTKGGKCEITTTTGDIRIDIKK